MFNITNFTCQDNPPGQPREPDPRPTVHWDDGMPRAKGGHPSRDRGRLSLARRSGNAAGLAVAVLVSWLAYIPRRLGDHLFTINDNEAYWWGWQITKVHGGLGRRYRDPRFDTLAECQDCRGRGRERQGRKRQGGAGGHALRCVPGHGPDQHRGGELAMASGRPRRPNDPSIMASVEAAVSTVARPGPLSRLWHWRYELALAIGLPLAALAIGYTLGLAWLTGVAAAALALLVAALAWPQTRQWLIARAWCVITPHRVRTGCTHAWVQTRDGRLPVVLYTTPTEFGERVLLWCRAGITAGDFEGARDILRAACWASDVRVVVNDRRSHIVVLEVIRRLPPARPAGGDPTTPAWPHLPGHAEPDGGDSEEPAWYGDWDSPARSDK